MQWIALTSLQGLDVDFAFCHFCQILVCLFYFTEGLLEQFFGFDMAQQPGHARAVP